MPPSSGHACRGNIDNTVNTGFGDVGQCGFTDSSKYRIDLKEMLHSATLSTHLIPKTGTIVPDYQRAFYLPDERIRSSVIAITDFTRKYLVEAYKIPENKVALIYQGTDSQKMK